MLERGINQLDLANEAGVGRAALNEILNGAANPGAETLEKIAGGLKVDLVEIFATEEQAELLRRYRTDMNQLRAEVAELRMRVEQQHAIASEMPTPQSSGEKDARAKVSTEAREGFQRPAETKTTHRRIKTRR